MNNRLSIIVLNNLNKALLFIVLLELFLGGGGRLFPSNFLTIRMVLFFIVLAVNIPLFLLTVKIKVYTVKLLFAFTIPLVFSVIVGLINNANRSLIFEDVKPLSYFYSFIFFYLNIKNITDINRIIKLVKFCSFMMAALYIITYFAIQNNLIDFKYLYRVLSNSGEFAFRGEQAFFYKGFLFMCVGFFFHNNEKYHMSKIISIILFVAIILTFMRGFIVSLILTYVIFNLYITKVNLQSAFVLIASVIFLVGILSFYQTQKIGNRKESDNVRIETIKQVYQSTSFFDILTGHGFGKGVPIREVHMEISFLEIFYKQGILGLAFWIYLLTLSLRFFRKISLKTNLYLAKPMLLSIIFVYIQSFTNPFVNNPIGMSMVIISLISLNILQENNEKNIRLHSNL